MGNGEYQRLRRSNLRCSLLLLLLGSAAGSVEIGFAHSTPLPQWLPFQSWAYTVVEWTTRFLSAVLESFQQVLMMQVLVWWV